MKIVKALTFLVILLMDCLLINAQEMRANAYSCTVFKTIINDSNVNVRSLPLLGSEIKGKLQNGNTIYITGVSQEMTKIDNHYGPWYRIESEKKDESGKFKIQGWVFSKYVAIKNDLVVSTFIYKKYVQRDSSHSDRLILKISGMLHQREITVYPNKAEGQTFYTFTWNNDESGFYYSDPAGTFIWQPKDNSIKRITYLGQSVESAWVIFTDDFRYMLEDFGTGPGPRGLSVIDLGNNKEVFSGSYYENVHLRDHSITVVDVGYPWVLNGSELDKETRERFENFITQNPIATRSDGLDNTPIIVYELNIENGEKKFIECKYIVTQ